VDTVVNTRIAELEVSKASVQKHLGCTLRHTYNVLNGRRRGSRWLWLAIATHLGVPVEQLAGEDGFALPTNGANKRKATKAGTSTKERAPRR
jgi:hypothetical protein